MRASFFALLVVLLAGCARNVVVRMDTPQPPKAGLQESMAEVKIHDLRTPGVPDGRLEAAFGVPMGEVTFDSNVAVTVKQTLEAGLNSILRSTGIQVKQQYLCELQEFSVKTETTPLYWDVVGYISLVLKTEKKQFRLSGTHTERTYIWPGEEIIKRVMKNALGQVSAQMTTSLANEPPENLAGIKAPFPQQEPSTVATLSAPLSGLASQRPSATTSQENMSGGRYQPPLHNFSILLPNWPGLKVQDKHDGNEGRVSLTSDLGDLWAITYLRVPADLKPRLSDPTERDTVYSRFLKNYAMPTIQRIAPLSTIVHEEFLNEGDDRAYFAVINIPEESAMVRGNKRLDSVRGLIIFSKNGFMYMLENEMNTMAEERKFGQINPSFPDRKRMESSQTTLKRIKDSMVFN